MKTTISAIPRVNFVLCSFIAALVGCQAGQTPSLTQTGGPSAGPEQPIVNFSTPLQSFDLSDSGSTPIRFKVLSRNPATVKLVLDSNLDPSNGDEMDLSPVRSYDQSGAQDEITLDAHRYPFGTYWIRATIDDGQQRASYLAPGTVRIVSSSGDTGEDPNDAGLTGLIVLHDAGKPQLVDGRVPFIDLWHVLDVLDNLSPRVIVPIQINEPVELHKLQAFGYGQPLALNRRVELYKGTDANGIGTMIHQQDVKLESRFAGKWSTITFDPPLRLEPGAYGVSYHSEIEFTEWMAANCPNGAGYVWMSAFGAAPYAKLDSAAFGFAPNFALRLLGKPLDPKSPSARERPATPPTDVRLMYRNEDERLATTHADDPDVETWPIHVNWRQVTKE